MEVADPLAALRARVERGLRELDTLAPGRGRRVRRGPAVPAARGGQAAPAACSAWRRDEALGVEPERCCRRRWRSSWLHTFSLVHDDLPAMDDDDLRRGLPTTHMRYGEDVAILVGDALLAARLPAGRGAAGRTPERRLAVLALLARATGGMIGGQYLDVRAPDDADEAGSSGCTGSRRGAARGSGRLRRPHRGAGARRRRQRSPRSPPSSALLFQIVDDVLDATGSDELARQARRLGRRQDQPDLRVGAGRRRRESPRRTLRRRGEGPALRVRGETGTLVAVLEQVARRHRRCSSRGGAGGAAEDRAAAILAAASDACLASARSTRSRPRPRTGRSLELLQCDSGHHCPSK